MQVLDFYSILTVKASQCLYVCACSEHIMLFGDAKPVASCIDDGRGWKLSQWTGHHTQTCPSNAWSPWKQPSSKLAQGGCSNIMADRALPAWGCVAFKVNTSSLSFPVRQNETGGSACDTVSSFSTPKCTKTENKQMSVRLQTCSTFISGCFFFYWN